MLTLIIAVLIVLLGSGLCSSIETALFSVSPLKVRQLAQSNKPSAIALLAIREKMNRPIATIVILNNLFNIVGSIAIAQIADSVFGDTGLGLFSGVLTFLIIIFGEIIYLIVDRVLLLFTQSLHPTQTQSPWCRWPGACFYLSL